MSEVSLSVVPSPELLKAVPGAIPSAGHHSHPARPGEHPVTGTPNPFAALLSGVLLGAQGLPEGPAAGPFPADPPPMDVPGPDVGTAGTTILALPGTATATADTGNPLPVTGKELPPELGGTRQPPETAREPATTPPGADRPRTSLADLALSRPLEPATAATAENAATTTSVDPARAGISATVAGRLLTPGEAAARSKSPDPIRTPAGNPSLASASTDPHVTTPAADPVSAHIALVRNTAAELLQRSIVPAGPGTDFLAGQLAAFAVGSDSSAQSASHSGMPTLASNGVTDASSTALSSRLVSTTLPPLQPLGHASAFAGGLADRLLTIGGPGAHSARLKLHPEHLGALDVEISMDNGTAQVWFGTTTSQAREAIEASLPRLRELFADQGIQLTRTQVDSGGGQAGSHDFGNERRMAESAGAWNRSSAWQPGPEMPPADSRPARLLDVLA